MTMLFVMQALIVFAAGADSSSAVVSAVIAGVFMLANTGLMVWLQRLQRQQRDDDERPSPDRRGPPDGTGGPPPDGPSGV